MSNSLRSMTGFGRAERAVGAFRVAWRLKSVNQRFLDLTLKTPEECAEVEVPARALLKERLARGSVECRLSVQPEASGEGGMEVDELLLTELLRVEERLNTRARGHDRGAISLDRMVTWPGLLRTRAIPQEEGFRHALLEVLAEAVDDLVACRGREGEALGRVMSALLDELEVLRAQVRERLPLVRQALEERLRQRLHELAGELADPARLAQEIALLVNRGDVTEEMDRLAIHIQETRKALLGNEPAGRRLDFLCQELHREVNTLGSKSQDAELSRLGIEMKVNVEKLREQAQNLE